MLLHRLGGSDRSSRVGRVRSRVARSLLHRSAKAGLLRWWSYARSAASHHPRPCRPRPGGRRRAGRRAVDDDDGYGGCAGDGAASRGVVGGRVGDGAGDGERARRRRRGAGNQAADARRRVRRAAHRRLPLQRPPAADALPRGRPRPRQISHQPRQRRHRQAARRAVLDDLQGGGGQRPSRPHRRQRRLPQPGARHGDDAGEHRPEPREDIGGDHRRVHGALGAAVHRARPGVRPSPGSDHHLVQGLASRRS